MGFGAAAIGRATCVARPVLTCAATGAAVSKAPVVNSINDVARITLGPFNPFNLNEDPRGPANPYT